MKTEYYEIALTDIINYFAKDLTYTAGEIVGKPEYFVDTTKNAVVIKLYVLPKGAEAEAKVDAVAESEVVEKL